MKNLTTSCQGMNWDILDEKLPTPCHVIDLDRLDENLARIRKLKELSGCRVLLAVKGFSAPYLFEPIRAVLDGVSASGLYEARLGKERFQGHVQTYSPAFRPEDMDDIKRFSDAVVFNSAGQLARFGQEVREAGRMCGIRINPKKSSVWKKDADPCMPSSRLGIPLEDVTEELLRQVDGIHFHAMCEQQADALAQFVALINHELGPMLKKCDQLKWINLGGGQLIGREDYDVDQAAGILCNLSDEYRLDVILEPCEGVVTQCGFFATRVCDIVTNGEQTAILDASPICHMPDTVFRGWSRDVCEEAQDGIGYRYYLSGPTCFAGDTFGRYTFPEPLQIGDVLHFEDTAAYTWVKNNTFNGIPAPAICTCSRKDGLVIRKTYSYDTYYNGL